MNMLRVSALTIVAMLVGTTSSLAEERKIERGDLPSAVEKTVASESRGAKIRGFSEEKENGKTYYEAEMIVNGHTKDIQIDTSGAIVEVEEQVAMDALPAEVKAGLQARAGDGKLVKVETITKKDKLVAYEAQVTKGAKKLEVQVGPNGKPLDHEE